ncbi:DUF4760 domain-containing protein [Paracoccaceae bacterium GXU_MW_L88]
MSLTLICENSEAVQPLIGCAASFIQNNWYRLITALTPFILFGTAFLSLKIAKENIQSSRETARKRATLDMIEKVESTAHYQDQASTFRYYKRTNKLGALHDVIEQREKIDRSKVLGYLNHYELVSIGILTGTLDEDIYRKWMAGPFIRDWNEAARFIQRERWKADQKHEDALGTSSRDSSNENTKTNWTYRDVVFEHYQCVALKWDDNCLNLSEDYRHPTEGWGGPPDEAVSPADDPLPEPKQDSKPC